MALTAYGVVAAFQPSHEFGRVLAAHGGVFIVGSPLWEVAFDGFRPDRADILGAIIGLVGLAAIMYARQPSRPRAMHVTDAAPQGAAPAPSMRSRLWHSMNAAVLKAFRVTPGRVCLSFGCERVVGRATYACSGRAASVRRRAIGSRLASASLC
jgi:hypothetical protein